MSKLDTIISLDTINAIHNKINYLLKTYKSNELLIIFDVDLTLIQPTHPALYANNIKKYSSALHHTFEHLTTHQKNILLNLAVQSSPWQLVEIETPLIIKNLQNKNINIMACTNALSGTLGKIKKSEVWRYKELKKLGINFQNSTVPHHNVTIDHSYTFHKGILFTNGSNKGSTIKNFLANTNFYPNMLILIDDMEQNLIDVKNYLQNNTPPINFIGIEYTAKEKISHPLTEFEFLNFWWKLVGKTKEHKTTSTLHNPPTS